MHYFKITLILILILSATGCGKSPLLNKAKSAIANLAGTEEIKTDPDSSFDQMGVTFNWLTLPSLEEEGSFNLKLKEALRDNQRIEAYLWMPEMGHGSSPIEIKAINPMEIEYTELAFTMPGLWVLHINFIENEKVVDKWEKAITL